LQRYKPKSYRDVKGWIDNCPNYQKCPLCYGCRAYDSSYIKCDRCYKENAKFNVCENSLHNEKNLAKMILRETIDLDKIKKKNEFVQSSDKNSIVRANDFVEYLADVCEAVQTYNN
jgi:hypothetical protein